MTVLRVALLTSLMGLILTACNGDDPVITATASTTPTGTVSITPGPQVKFEKFGLSVNVPKGAEIIEKGLIQEEANENSGRIEWGDSSKDGLASIFWMRGVTRQTYDVSAGTASIANSYNEQPVGVVSNLSELERTTIANFEVDARTYDFEFFKGAHKGFVVALQCTNSDALFFINVIHKESPPREIVERVLSGFSCK